MEKNRHTPMPVMLKNIMTELVELRKEISDFKNEMRGQIESPTPVFDDETVKKVLKNGKALF